MPKETVKVVIVALVAILLTLMVLLFVAANPWMLAGVAAVLLAIAAIIQAINGGLRGGPTNSVNPPPTTSTGAVSEEDQALE